jgi:peptidoglycan/LPS O-acetylase OafA/YrhL
MVSVAFPGFSAPASAPKVKLGAASRLDGLDAIRFLAIAGIVWRHAAEGLPVAVGFFGVPFFIIVALLLLGRTIGEKPATPLPTLFRKRFARIYLPFLAWCLVYEAMRQSKQLAQGEVDFSHFTAFVLLGGTYRHLWFLPFLLLSILIAAPSLKWAASNAYRRGTLGCAAVLGAVVFIALPMPNALTQAVPGHPAYTPLAHDREFLLSVWQAAPSAFCGLALAAFVGLSMSRIGWGPLVSLAGLMLLVLTTAMQWDLREPDIALSTLGGLAALMMVNVGGPTVQFLAKLGRLSFGIYLAHVVFIRLGIQALKLEPHQLMPAQAGCLFIAGLTGSLAATMLLRKSKYTKWTIGE